MPKRKRSNGGGAVRVYKRRRTYKQSRRRVKGTLGTSYLPGPAVRGVFSQTRKWVQMRGHCRVTDVATGWIKTELHLNDPTAWHLSQQFMGYDQMKAMYTKCVVTKASLSFKLINKSDRTAVVCWGASDKTLPFSATGTTENMERYKHVTIPGAGSATTGGQHKMVLRKVNVRMNQVIGKRYISYISEDDYHSLQADVSPTDLVYFALIHGDADGASASDLEIHCDILASVMFYDPIAVTKS